MPRAYMGAASLLDFEVFSFHLLEVGSEVATHFQVNLEIDERTARIAHNIFSRSLIDILQDATTGQRQVFGSICVALANATALAHKHIRPHRLVTIGALPQSQRLVNIDILTLQRYTDEILGVLFGGSVYLLESALRTGVEPDCQMTYFHVAQLAQILKVEPISKRQFVKAIKRRKVK